MRNKLRVLLIGLMAVAASAALQAAENPAEAPNPNDPTVNQVYEAARAGHLDQAKQMMAIVLAHHPQSSRAHYVAAEIDADMKNYGDAREELAQGRAARPGPAEREPTVRGRAAQGNRRSGPGRPGRRAVGAVARTRGRHSSRARAGEVVPVGIRRHRRRGGLRTLAAGTTTPGGSARLRRLSAGYHAEYHRGSRSHDAAARRLPERHGRRFRPGRRPGERTGRGCGHCRGRRAGRTRLRTWPRGRECGARARARRGQ